MFGPRMLFGAAVGGALVYFLDPQNGARRREQVREWWKQNREPVMDSAGAAASTVQAKAADVQAKAAATSAKVNEKVSELGARVRGESSEVPTK